MNITYLACLSALLATNLVQAAPQPCDSFEIKIKNATTEDFRVVNVRLSEATILPDSIQTIPNGTEQIFTVSNSSQTATMKGEFNFSSLSDSTKKIKIQFDIKNSSIYCRFNDKPQENIYTIEKTRLPGKAVYKIS